MNDIIESYLVNEKLYVSTKFLRAYFNRTDKQIGRWKSEGLPKATKPKEINKRGDYFILEEVIKWVNKNINKSKSSNSKGHEDEEEDIADVDKEKLLKIYMKGSASEKRQLLLFLPRVLLDDFKKMEDIITTESKNKGYDTAYIHKDKAKLGEDEVSSMFVSLLKTSMPVLSKELEMKTQNEIYHDLDRHFKKEFDKLFRYIDKDEDEIISFAEVMQEMMSLVTDRGMTHDKLLKIIEGL